MQLALVLILTISLLWIRSLRIQVRLRQERIDALETSLDFQRERLREAEQAKPVIRIVKLPVKLERSWVVFRN